MEGVVYGDLTDAVLVGEMDALVDCLVGSRLSELFVGIPDLARRKTASELFDFCAGHATTSDAAEEVVQVQGFNGIVGANAMLCRKGRETCRLGGFLLCVFTVLIRGGDEGVVLLGLDDVELFSHSLDNFG